MAIDQKLISRINELAKLKKERELTEEEKIEQGTLRGKYLEAIKKNFRGTLNNIDIVDELILENVEIEKVKKVLTNVEAIKDIIKNESNVVVTYLCKDITENEILEKVKKYDKLKEKCYN